MKLSLSKRLEIGKIIYDRHLSVRQASIKYGISEETAKQYLRIYRETNNLEPFLDQKPIKSFDEVLHYDVFQMKSFMVNYFYIPLDNFSSVFDSGEHELLFSKAVQDKLINESINNIDAFIDAYEKGALKPILSEEELIECSLVYEFLNCKLNLLNTIYRVDNHYIVDDMKHINYQDWNIGVLAFDKKTEQKLYDLDICLLSDIILKEKKLDLQNDLYFQLRKRLIIYFFQVDRLLKKTSAEELSNLKESKILSSSSENIAIKTISTPTNHEQTIECEITHDESYNHLLGESNCDINNYPKSHYILNKKNICDEEKNNVVKAINYEEELNNDNDYVPVDCLNLSVRTLNALKRHNIKSLSDLRKLSIDDLYKIRNLGKKSVDELSKYLIETTIDINQGEKNELKELLSVRSYNCLEKYGITKIEQLKELSIDEITEIPHLGLKSIEEILSLMTSLGGAKEWNCDYKILNNNIYCASRNVFIKDTKIESLLLSYRSTHYLINCNVYKLSDLINYTNDDFNRIKNIGSKSIVEIKLAALHYLQNPENELSFEKQIEASIAECKFDGCQKNYIIEKFSNTFEIEQIEDVLSNLIEEKTIFEYEGKLFFRYDTFPQFLYKLEKSQDKDIMFRRINGESLEEIGSSYNLTRERIRQKQEKFVKKNIGDIDNPIHIFKEDRYRYIYENYELYKKEFCEIFEEKERTYNYLIMRYKRGKKDISDAAKDTLIPNRLRGLIATYGLRNYILIEGEYIKKERRSLLIHYLKSNRKIFKIRDLVDQFNQYIIDMQLEEPEKFTIDYRYINGDAGFDKCILIIYPSSVRYYDFYNYDFSELIEEIDLESFRNIQVSTLKLFNKFPSLMKKYDINDEYELHNILKKIYDEKSNERIIFKRMPIIQIDDFDRNNYVVSTWRNNGYVSQAQLARIISDEIGIGESVALAVWIINSDVPELSKRINNNPFVENEINFLSNALTKSFYWVDEIKKISESFSDDLKTKIDSVNMKKVGYNLYNLYAVREPLTATQYFRNILLEKDTFYYPDFSEFKYLSNFTSIYDNLRHELEIIEFESDRYITSSKLSQFGYGKEKIKEIGTSIKNQVADYKYFTIYSLRKAGFDFEIDELGFSDKIIESIIKYATDLEYIKVLNTYVFSANRISFLDLVNDELCKIGKIETDDLIYALKEKYGIEVTKEYIQKFTCETTIYYDSIMDSFYENYKKYLEDIC